MKNIVITGATSGIGFAVLNEIIIKGENIIAIGINEKECEETYLKLGNPKNVHFIAIDLSSNKAIKRGSVSIMNHFGNSKIDVLINCAGIVPQWYQTNDQGFEMQFQVNHLAIVNLTLCLLDYIKNAEGIVINTASRVHRWAELDYGDLMNRNKYFLLNAYKKSKLCNVLFTYEFNRRYKEDKMLAYSVDPGLVNTKIGERNTVGFLNVFWKIRRRFGKSPSYVAKTFIKLIYDEKNYNEPFYYQYEKQLEPSDYGKDESHGKKLWEISKKYLQQ